MRNILLAILYICVPAISFASSTNTFFIMKDTISLECKDVKKITKKNNYQVHILYSQSGREKMYTFTKINKNKKLGLIADNSLIFFNLKIHNPLASKEKFHDTNGGISFYSENPNIDKFINTFKHCKGLVK